MSPLFGIIAGIAASAAIWLLYRLLVRRAMSRHGQLEGALLESQHKFRTILASSNDAIVLAEVGSGRVIDCNWRAEELVGLPHAQLVGLPRIELHPLADVARCRELFEREASVGSASARELHIVNRNGYLVPVDVSTRVIPSDGHPVAVSIFRTSSGTNVPEETLRQERRFTDALLETVQALIMVLDREGRIIRFNHMCEILTGYGVDQVRGRHVWDVLIPARDVDRNQQVFAGWVAGELPGLYESAWLTKQGSERLIAWSHSAILDDDGRVRHVIATGIDMTARKSAEDGLRRAHDEMEKRVVLRTAALRAANDALVQSESRLAEAQRIAHVGSWEWDLASNQIFWSDETYRIFGVDVGQYAPSFESLLELIHPLDRAAVRAAATDAVQRHVPYSINHRVLRPDGTERVVHEEGVVRFSADGRAHRMTGTVQDITERNAAEEALRRAHDELEARVESRTAELSLANQALSFTQFAMDRAADAVFWMNDEFQFIYVNDTACRFLGYDRRELLSLGISGISTALDSEECCRRLENARQSGLTFEWVFRRANGSEFPVEITANRLRFYDNENICLFARDISERRRAEEARQAQLLAARTLSAISLRFVALDDIDFAVREALTDLQALLEAKCAWLLRVERETIAVEWESVCRARESNPRPPLLRFQPLLAALRQGEVQVLREDADAGAGAPAVLLVPLFAEQVLVGAIAFDQARQVERWREDDFPLLRVAARVITGAIQRHRAELQIMTLLEENRRLARQSLEIQEHERAHLSRELHDEMGQCLTAIRADAQTICRLSSGRELRIYDSGKAIDDVASRVYEVVRNIMRRLRPEMLDELGLGQALRDVVNQWQARHPEIEWMLSVSEPLGTLPEAVQITAFRLVQESITNVIKHAQADRVEVQVMRSRAGLEVLVRDDGLGENPKGQRGFGLLGMRERVLAAGGRFEVSNQPGQGYRVYALFPLPEMEEQQNAV